jgi:hypothetical protein
MMLTPKALMQGLPGWSAKFAARSKVQEFFELNNVRRVPQFARQRYVAHLRLTATLCGKAQL